MPITANMSIFTPVAGQTNYDQSFQSGMNNVDNHDHSGPPLNGKPLSTNSLIDGSITINKLNTAIGTTGIYATGPFTPELEFGGASTGITYSSNTGKFTVYANVVYYVANIVLTSKGSASGNATVHGLPYIAGAFSTVDAVFAFGNITLPASCTYAWGSVSIGNQYVDLFATTPAGANSALANTNFTNTSQFTVSGFYFLF